jgi:hypothetical protein
MYIIGIAGLLSMNYGQSGIFQAIMSYVMMVMTFLLFAASVLVDRVDDKIRCILFIVFYVLGFGWYLGIVIDYFVTSGAGL